MAFQTIPVYVRGTFEPNGLGFLCSSPEGGGHGSALTGSAYVLTIDPVPVFTESKFESLNARAIQDDIAMAGPPQIISPVPTGLLRPCWMNLPKEAPSPGT